MITASSAKHSEIRGRKARLDNAWVQKHDGRATLTVADLLHLPRRDAWKVQNQPERNELFAQHEVRISSGAPADALSLQRIYAKAPAILCPRSSSNLHFRLPDT